MNIKMDIISLKWKYLNYDNNNKTKESNFKFKLKIAHNCSNWTLKNNSYYLYSISFTININYKKYKKIYKKI